jgi:very-short-patch-repair endonuclease
MPYYRRRRYYRRSDPAKFDKAYEMRHNPTRAEAAMWDILRGQIRQRFPDQIFRRQYVQYGYIIDFYCPTLRMGIEVDGYVHDDQKKYDIRRDRRLARRGIHVFRFSNDNVLYNTQAVASDLCQIIEVRLRHRNYSANAVLENKSATQTPTTTQIPTTATTLQTERSCFIATAAYGTPMAQEINILRRFRDSRVKPNLIARHFVTLYYNASPPLARVISRNKKMKAFVRLSLKPIIHLVESSNSS